MDKSLIPQYLANVLAIVRTGNVITDSERKATEEVCSTVGGNKKDLKKAEKLAQANGFLPKLVGRFSDKVRNIEDLIYVSIADGNMGQEKVSRIMAFANELGLNKEIVEQIIAEGKTRLDAKKPAHVCPNCGFEVLGDAKFCPECGAPLAATTVTQKTVQVDFNYPKKGISIEFAESTSANFDTALGAAKASPDFQVCERSRKHWYLATWPREQIASALTLVDALKGLRNRKVYVNGNRLQWDEVFAFHWCLKQRQQAYRPIEYCFGLDNDHFNIWGCRKANMDWNSWADWLSYGRFRSKDVFVFDKERIRHEIESNIYKVRFCPYLRIDLVSAVLELFPDEVHVSERSGWDYKEEYEQKPRSIKIIRTESHDGFTSKAEFWTSGVSPVGYGVAVDILREALKRCAIHDIDLKALVSK